MRGHTLRPLYVVLALIVIILAIRPFIVPSEFGVHEAGYMYGWHRKSNEEEWKGFPIKFRGRQYCKDCHQSEFSSIIESPHFIIECENCHGLSGRHPEDPQTLSIERSPEHCLRCHARLPYPQTLRAEIKGIEPERHNKGTPCIICHNPHSPGAKR